MRRCPGPPGPAKGRPEGMLRPAMTVGAASADLPMVRYTGKVKAAIIGLAGPRLAPEEALLLRRHAPAGVILFARNVETPQQLGALIADIRAEQPQALVMVDQEGGRVARLRPPHWRAHPSAANWPGVGHVPRSCPVC